MGRLIDADVFIQEITDEITNLRLNGLKGTPRPTSDLYAIIDRIKEQPTAYDVEKVVAELVEMRNKDSQGCKDVGNKCLSYTDCGLCIMDRAIDIVKRGGVDD